MVPIEGSVLELAKPYMYKNHGFAFVHVMERGDIPEGFDYASGIILHRMDTLSIVLVSRHYATIAVNSWSVTEWTGWKIFTGVAL